MSATPIALAGIGKIARDQHIPHIAASPAFTLAAAVTSQAQVEGVPGYATVTEMKQAHPKVAALSICTPPIGRYALIEEAFACGLDVMVEKPPAATVSEAQAYVELARRHGRVLFVTWHSRQAAAVAPAKAWLANRTVRQVRCGWKEDVRVWHPGQTWIWSPGIGVFDPGINALSVLTEILPAPVVLRVARLKFPENKAAPIAADLDLICGAGAPAAVEFDFDYKGEPHWTITVETDGGVIELTEGGARWSLDGAAQPVPDQAEYAGLYRRFSELLAARQSDIDLTPFQLTADAFLLGERSQVQPFTDF